MLRIGRRLPPPCSTPSKSTYGGRSMDGVSILPILPRMPLRQARPGPQVSALLFRRRIPIIYLYIGGLRLNFGRLPIGFCPVRWGKHNLYHYILPAVSTLLEILQRGGVQAGSPRGRPFQPFLRFYGLRYDWEEAWEVDTFQPFLRFYILRRRGVLVSISNYVFQPFLRFYHSCVGDGNSNARR